DKGGGGLGREPGPPLRSASAGCLARTVSFGVDGDNRSCRTGLGMALPFRARRQSPTRPSRGDPELEWRHSGGSPNGHQSRRESIVFRPTVVLMSLALLSGEAGAACGDVGAPSVSEMPHVTIQERGDPSSGGGVVPPTGRSEASGERAGPGSAGSSEAEPVVVAIGGPSGRSVLVVAPPGVSVVARGGDGAPGLAGGDRAGCPP